MISYKIVKKLRLKIDTFSTSLIVFATRPSVQLLRIIKRLSKETKSITVSLDIEVIDSTSYNLLFEND